MKQSEESAAVKIIKHRYGSTAQIILGTASGQFLAVTEDFCKAPGMKSALMPCKNQEESRMLASCTGLEAALG
jgi:hypothetical protein